MAKKTKKIKKVQIDQSTVPSEDEIKKVQISQPTVPSEDEAEQLTVPSEVKTEVNENLQEKELIEPSGSKLMNVGEATKVAMNFLKSLGVKKTMPNKASNEGNKAYVELDFQGKKATIFVDGKTKEILEYQIEQSEERQMTTGGPITVKLLLIIIGIQFLLMILFSFVKPYIPLPLP